jgi:DNA polymerase-3 subunit alpha
MLWRQVQNCLGHEVPTTSGTALIVELVPVGKRHVYDIEVEDVHSFFANGIAVHNCTGRGAQQLFMKAKPKSIVDIAALTSIYRPGPLAAKVDDLWLKHACEHYDWGHPLINETLKETRGLLIFQEGVMSLANKVAGFPLEKCDEVRRAIMKRSIAGGEAAKKKTKELEDSIVDGAVKNGVPRNIAEKMYETITWMSGYGFNKCFPGEIEILTIDKSTMHIKIKKIVDKH